LQWQAIYIILPIGIAEHHRDNEVKPLRERERRLNEYAPLWGQWQPGRCLYDGSASAVYELKRVRCDKELVSVVKLIEIRAAAPEQLRPAFSRAVDEIELMEKFSGAKHLVAIRDDQIREVRDSGGRILGYDILIRMDSLTCLADLLREGVQLPEREVRKLGRDICSALAYAHALGCVHRDVKPANIYRNAVGDYLLGDFGVSARGGELNRESAAGTSAYMAPDLAQGQRYDFRADVYSLGLVLYQLLNHNHLPFTDEHSTYSQRGEARRRRLEGAALPAPAGGGKALGRAVLKACRSDPERRYATAGAFARALAELEGKQPRSRGLKVWAAAVLCLLCLAGGGAAAHWLWPGQQPALEQEPPGASGGAAAEEAPDHSRYEVIVANMTWENAKVYCEARGGHLATVASREEETEITALLDELRLTAVWLGANNRNSAKGFQWLTGERFSYAPWGLNEPNNTNGVEYYLMMQLVNGEWVWNDSRDDGLDNFNQSQVGLVCEWDETDAK